MNIAEKVDKVTALIDSGIINISQAKILLGFDIPHFQFINNQLLYYNEYNITVLVELI